MEINGESPMNHSNANSSIKKKWNNLSYNGGMFGGFKMTDSSYPRKTNLNERKKSVLKIASENFRLVKRLQSARSGGYAEEMLSGRGTPNSSRRPNSRINFAYPNQIEHKSRRVQ